MLAGRRCFEGADTCKVNLKKYIYSFLSLPYIFRRYKVCFPFIAFDNYNFLRSYISFDIKQRK